MSVWRRGAVRFGLPGPVTLRPPIGLVNDALLARYGAPVQAGATLYTRRMWEN
jgi:hypothetical protein